MKLESLLCSCGTFLISHDLLSNNLATLLWRQDKNTKTVHKTPRDRCASHQNTPSSRIEDGKFLKKAVEGEEAKKKLSKVFFSIIRQWKVGARVWWKWSWEREKNAISLMSIPSQRLPVYATPWQHKTFSTPICRHTDTEFIPHCSIQ